MGFKISAYSLVILSRDLVDSVCPLEVKAFYAIADKVGREMTASVAGDYSFIDDEETEGRVQTAHDAVVKRFFDVTGIRINYWSDADEFDGSAEHLWQINERVYEVLPKFKVYEGQIERQHFISQG